MTFMQMPNCAQCTDKGVMANRIEFGGIYSMSPFPEEWSDRLKAIVLDMKEPCFGEFTSISKSDYPETRTVMLRYLQHEDSILICTNITHPKWNQVKEHPFVAFGTYFANHGLALRLKAKAECFSSETAFSKQAWDDMPQLHREKYLLAVAGGTNAEGVSPIYGCIRLIPNSWIIDRTGSDGWIERRQIYERNQEGIWKKVLDRKLSEKR
ncbi:MAG: pyridoxamine 5'-phosphate oxidase family protein [Thiohalocapsa sp. PB-PSB1]|jgi:uncharacterized pyridoxamine 5'-phosphate oxidase family protein|nr:MAG: pyridoxamine 5'-phosphate oxidase family protein [Thiohalocapsa sp. PB-PSB1]